MESSLQTLEYFSRCLIPPLYEVFDILYNPEHQEFNRLLHDLGSIDDISLNFFVVERQIDHLINNNEDIDTVRRAYCLIERLQLEISRSRIDQLLLKTKRPNPYNSENLKDKIIDQNHLIFIHQFNLDNFRLQWSDKVYMICPTTAQSNSSYWIFQTLLKYTIKDRMNFKIRLDPLLEIPEFDYHPLEYRMTVHGKPLDWDKLKSLRNDDFGQWFDDKEYNRIGFTDYVWAPRDSEIHFTCEELPKPQLKGLKSSRYFHAIFNKKNGKIIHCDGAIRVYSDYELEERSKYHVKDSEVRKAAKRIKIFQFESQDNLGQEIEQEAFTDLVTSFFVWNYDIQMYFSH